MVDFLGLKRGFSEEELEDAVVEQLEKFIMELGQDFAFLERQKKIPVDSIDYKLDLLFYHRRLYRLLAIDLKLGKFKPEYKGQMELYLKYLKKYEMQPGEEEPIWDISYSFLTYFSPSTPRCRRDIKKPARF